MWIADTIDSIRSHRRALKGCVAFVPTMGALHDGHVSLIHAGRKQADHVLVSIFVNPTQFGPGEDFTRYPRPIERDLEMCKSAGATGVFVPSVEQMYPQGGLACDVNIPALATILEGEFRPGHFAGVCRVVAKLFNITQPDVAVFGQKDYQQLKVIEAMVADLNMPVRIDGQPTIREPDGLARSSRNVFLDAESRRKAVALFKALNEAQELVENEGETDPSVVEHAMKQVLEAHGLSVDYATIRHPHTLATLDLISPSATHGVAALITARIGGVRLLDNRVLGVARA